ncbi:MAG: peptide ABC transporter substrate-binding protein, partial [Dehalococcoidia bacterium]
AVMCVGWAAVSGSPAGHLPAQGGRYIEGSVGPAPLRINPLFAAADGPERDLAALVFSGLTRPGPNGEPEPDLAESWVASTDATSFTFLLRHDVTWHDGAPFDADDVLFTASAFAAPGVKGDPATAEVWRRARVQKLGQFAVLFQFDAPFSPFLSYASAGILPRHLLGKDTPAQLVDDPFNQRPIGTGPYVFRSLSASAAELQRNTAYYLDVPYIDRLTVRFVPDQPALLRAIERHEVSAGLPAQSLSVGDLASLTGTGHQLLVADRSAYSVVYLNLNLAQFQDPVVRRALSQATDRTKLVAQLLPGQAATSDVPIPAGVWHDPAPPAQADPSGAHAALLAAGWTAGTDGTLRKRGIALSFTLLTTSDPQRQSIAAALAAQWHVIGANVTVQTQPDASVLNDALIPHKYEAVLFGWDSGPDPDPFTAWHSAQTGQQVQNLSGYASDRADQLLDALRQSTDPSDQSQLYGAFAETFRQDMPAIVLFFPRYVYAVPGDLRTPRFTALDTPSHRFAAIERWSLKTRRN